jgi:hypothetical protein
MAVIINPRGAGGAGKTRLARRVMAEYGWGWGGQVEPIRHGRRERPIGYRIAHPHGGRTLAVIGHYEMVCGGCDTIRATDGGMDTVFRLAGTWASAGHDVLLEGLLLSGESLRSAALAEAHDLHVLRLGTPLDRCVRNLVARRHARRDTWPHIVRSVAALDAAVEEACRTLQRGAARVEVLGFDDALRRARELLGLELHGLGQAEAAGERLAPATADPAPTPRRTARCGKPPASILAPARSAGAAAAMLPGQAQAGR